MTKKVFYYLLLSIFLTTLLISIKSIPDFGISGSIFRNDIIDPLAGGGSLESDISSFILGTRIDTLWAQYESGVMIGVIPLLFVIIALIYGKREIIVPSFAAIILSIIWADGGKTLFSFIHLFPLVDNFRNPGRIFGALLPIILFLALYGTIILFEKIKKGGSFDITSEQRNRITIGVVLLLMLKVIELSYQVAVGYMVIVTVLLLAGFVALLYFGKGSLRNILFYSVFALFVNLILIFTTYPIPGTDNLIKLVFITFLFTALFLFIQKEQKNTACSRYFCAILLAGIVIMMAGNLSSNYITIYNPKLDKSPALDIISEIKKIPTDNVQLWVYETGIPIWHMDFSYWDVVNAIHPMSVYSAYYLKTMPQITYSIGNVTYFSADFIVDTQYLENGNQNIPEASFKIHNISVYRPENILPNVFLLRENVVYSLKIEKYSPDEVIVSGQFSEGDTVLLKGAYYTGWTANGIKSEPIGNMIGTKVSSKIDKITFKFDPLDYKIGALLSGLGAILLVVIIIKRDNIERFINKHHVQGTAMGSKKKKKK